MVDFDPLTSYLRRVPAVGKAIGTGAEAGVWWCKFALDIEHPPAWNVVQELGQIAVQPACSRRAQSVMNVAPDADPVVHPRRFTHSLGTLRLAVVFLVRRSLISPPTRPLMRAS